MSASAVLKGRRRTDTIAGDPGGSLTLRLRAPAVTEGEAPYRANASGVFAKAGISTTAPPLSTYADFLATSKKVVSSGAADRVLPQIR